MRLFEDPEALHDFPDRSFRRLLHEPANLRELVADLLPELVARLDFTRLEVVPTQFLLEDWRQRHSDLLFRLPLLPAPGEPPLPPLLVCLLIEHQSAAEADLVLRALLYAVLFWEAEWREGEQRGEGVPQLSPVVPIVFYTGAGQWRLARSLAELIGGPAELQAYLPQWRPLFWEVGAHTVGELEQAVGDWLSSLAVVRAEREEATLFREVFGRALGRLERLRRADAGRWRELVWFLLSWGLLRRSGSEREGLVAVARASQRRVRDREEIGTMSETIERTWEQELLARGQELGRAEGVELGRAEGVELGQLASYRESLRLLLEERFGALPREVVARIEATTEPERLRAALRQVVHLGSLAEFEL